MRSVFLLLVLAACGARPAAPTLPGAPAAAPARDLAAARTVAPNEAKSDAAAPDPRVVDLDIIRITAKQTAPGADPEMEHVATADLMKDATQAAKGGETERALSIYRRIVNEFPESRFAPTALFDIAAIYDGRGDVDTTITTLRELVNSYPQSRESIDGHLYIAALQADHAQFADAVTTLDAALARPSLTFADRIEANARKGYCLLELHRYDDADAALQAAVDAWHQVPHLDDPYYIAMAVYYRGELAHRRFQEAPVRLPDDQLIADLEAKRVLAVQAYDRWKESLDFKQAYWATAAGYQMSQIFVELWEATVKAPYPHRIDSATRPRYVIEVHDRVREHLEKALEGHRMNVELAKAYGVDTTWSKGSAQRAAQIMEMLAKDSAGQYVTPD
ncbi:MAG TPA: tetratricopeptide repeat protein [Kofleriaceae bacterium]|nr:tetratricopeptide repeat protein [Kofleriaceae bacterium]